VTLFAKDDDGRIFIRHTITTGTFDVLHEREEMSTRNFDSISNFYTARLAALRGNLTATTEGLTAVFDAVQKASNDLMLRYRGAGTSGQIVAYKIGDIKVDDNFKDIILIPIELELPLMANRIELYLQAISDNSAVGTVTIRA